MVQQNRQPDSPGIYLHPGKRTDNFIVFRVHFSQLDASAHPFFGQRGLIFSMSLVKQLAPRWELNAVISQANAPLSVLLPVKNGSDKIPAVSIAPEIWIALNGGKQTALLLCFLQVSPKIIQRELMELDRLLARFLFCIAELSEPLIPAALLACTREVKKSLDLWSSRVSCICWMWHLPGFTAKQWICTPTSLPFRVSVNTMQCSGREVPGDRRKVWNHRGLGDQLGWQPLTHSQPSPPHLKASSFPAWFSDTISPRTSFPQCLFLPSLGPVPRWNHKKEQELSPITAESLFCKWSLVAKRKVQHIYRALAQFLGAELTISTIQTRTIAQPSQRKNQLITRSPDWLPVVCVRFLEYVCKALVTLIKKTIVGFSENSGKKAEISGEEHFNYSTG